LAVRQVNGWALDEPVPCIDDSNGPGRPFRDLLCPPASIWRRPDMKLKLKVPSPALVISCIALLVALGPKASAVSSSVADPNSVDTAAIQNQAVTTPKLADEAVNDAKIAPGSVTASKIAANAITATNVVNNSITLAKISGADVKITVTLNAGTIPNGRCQPHLLTVAGARIGEAVLISLQGQTALQNGILIQGTQVVSAGQVTAMICNMSGTTQNAIRKVVRVVTFG
jgi:hypothetical protein